MKECSMKELRLSKKLNRLQASEKAGISTQYLDMIEKGSRQPSDAVKRNLASAYNVSPLQIFLSCETTQSRIKTNAQQVV